MSWDVHLRSEVSDACRNLSVLSKALWGVVIFGTLRRENRDSTGCTDSAFRLFLDFGFSFLFIKY